MIWKEKRVLLIVLALLLLANTVFFFTYRVRYETRLADLDARLEQSEARLEQARNARQTAERQYASYRQIQRDIDLVYNQRWSTQEERLVPLISEVKRLAIASQLEPRAYSFDRTESVQRDRRGGTLGATSVGIAFQVHGTYQQVRRLINLLELSEQFVIIDRIGLTAGNDQMLTMGLHVKTLFRDTTPAPPRAAAGTRRDS